MENKFAYVISLFNIIYGVDASEFGISFGEENHSKVNIRKGDVGFFSKREKYDIKKVVWKEWKSTRIPFLFDNNEESEIISFNEGTAIINFDIISSAFFFLSNWQELQFEKKGLLNRFPYEESIQCKLDIICLPVVNYYFDILKSAIEKTCSVSLKPRPWREHSFATFISHDIDTCESGWLQGGFNALKKGRLLTTLDLILKKIAGKDVWFNFSEIISLEQSFDIKSTFFFLGRRDKFKGMPNADYELSNRKFGKAFEEIKLVGSEIGIHGSLGSSNNTNRFKEDLKKFGIGVEGNRYHFLEFDPVESLRVLEESGIKFDSSMGFAEHYGFRNGICMPFYLYDIPNDRPSSVLEIPLILMDGTLQSTKYLNIAKDQIAGRIGTLIAEIEKFGGLFTLLWHNTHFSDYKYQGWKQIFEEITGICRKENSAFVTGSEILRRYGSKI